MGGAGLVFDAMGFDGLAGTQVVMCMFDVCVMCDVSSWVILDTSGSGYSC